MSIASLTLSPPYHIRGIEGVNEAVVCIHSLLDDTLLLSLDIVNGHLQSCTLTTLKLGRLINLREYRETPNAVLTD
jgi:hypothetical protein